MSQAKGSTSSQSETTLRSKIVGILSDTANGCLTELGYFPGLLKKHQELEQTNAQWKDENVKLFRDNQALAKVIRYHQDRLKQKNAAPDNTGKVALLEEQVKSLTIQNAELKKQNATLTASGSSQSLHAPYQQLVVDYQQLSVVYRTAMTEIQHLRQQVMQMNANATPTPGMPYMVPSQTNPIRAPEQRPPQEHHIPISMAQRSPVNQIPDQALYNTMIPSRVHAPAVPHGAIYQPQHAFTQSVASIYHGQQESIPPQPPRPPSGMRVVAQGPPQQMIVPTHATAPSPVNTVSYSHRPPLNIKTSFPTNPGDGPLSSGHPVDTQNLHFGSPHGPVGWAPYPPAMRRSSHPNSWPASRPATQSPSHAAPSPHPIDTQNLHFGSPHTPVGRAHYPPALRRSSHPNSRPVSRPATQSPSHAAPSPSSSTVKGVSASGTFQANFAPYKSMSPPESVAVATPPSRVQEALSVEVNSSPVLGLEELKRPRESMGDATDDLGSVTKKARLDDGSHVNEEAEKDTADAEDESEQEIEVDEDGLRSVASCISELVETSAEDPQVQTCRLCDLRHKNGLISEIPKPFLLVTQDDLVQHMTTEHAEAWETLRRDV